MLLVALTMMVQLQRHRVFSRDIILITMFLFCHHRYLIQIEAHEHENTLSSNDNEVLHPSLENDDSYFDINSVKPQIAHYKGYAGTVMAKQTLIPSSGDSSEEGRRRLIAFDMDPILPPYDDPMKNLQLILEDDFDNFDNEGDVAAEKMPQEYNIEDSNNNKSKPFESETESEIESDNDQDVSHDNEKILPEVEIAQLSQSSDGLEDPATDDKTVISEVIKEINVEVEISDENDLKSPDDDKELITDDIGNDGDGDGDGEVDTDKVDIKTNDVMTSENVSSLYSELEADVDAGDDQPVASVRDQSSEIDETTSNQGTRIQSEPSESSPAEDNEGDKTDSVTMLTLDEDFEIAEKATIETKETTTEDSGSLEKEESDNETVSHESIEEDDIEPLNDPSVEIAIEEGEGIITKNESHASVKEGGNTGSINDKEINIPDHDKDNEETDGGTSLKLDKEDHVNTVSNISTGNNGSDDKNISTSVRSDDEEAASLNLNQSSISLEDSGDDSSFVSNPVESSESATSNQLSEDTLNHLESDRNSSDDIDIAESHHEDHDSESNVISSTDEEMGTGEIDNSHLEDGEVDFEIPDDSKHEQGDDLTESSKSIDETESSVNGDEHEPLNEEVQKMGTGSVESLADKGELHTSKSISEGAPNTSEIIEESSTEKQAALHDDIITNDEKDGDSSKNYIESSLDENETGLHEENPVVHDEENEKDAEESIDVESSISTKAELESDSTEKEKDEDETKIEDNIEEVSSNLHPVVNVSGEEEPSGDIDYIPVNVEVKSDFEEVKLDEAKTGDGIQEVADDGVNTSDSLSESNMIETTDDAVGDSSVITGESGNKESDVVIVGSAENLTEEKIENEDDNDDGDNSFHTKKELEEKNSDAANHEFVTGLDDIQKFFEVVDPPDELDPGASGHSLEDVLKSQGIQIIKTRVNKGIQYIKRALKRIRERLDGFEGPFDLKEKVEVILENNEDRIEAIKEFATGLKDGAKDVKDSIIELVTEFRVNFNEFLENIGFTDKDDFESLYDEDDIENEELARQLLESYSTEEEAQKESKTS